jgi:hypothetical protein
MATSDLKSSPFLQTKLQVTFLRNANSKLGHYARGYNSIKDFEVVWDVNNLQKLHEHLALCQQDFVFFLHYHGYLIPWNKEWYNMQILLADYEIQQLTQLKLEFTMLKLNKIKLSPENVRMLDEIEFPAHGIPSPPNPVFAHPLDRYTSFKWGKLFNKKRKPSKDIQRAFQRLLRRCIYFLLQLQLEKYWFPSLKGLHHARNYFSCCTQVMKNFSCV